MAQRSWDRVEQPDERDERQRAGDAFLVDRTGFPSADAPQTLTPGERLLLDLLIERHRDVLVYLADK